MIFYLYLRFSSFIGVNCRFILMNFYLYATFDDGTAWPSGIAIDYVKQRLYWADTKKHTIETTDFNGIDRHIVYTFTGMFCSYFVLIYI